MLPSEKMERKQDVYKYRRVMKDVMTEINEEENKRRDNHLLSRVIGESALERRLVTQLLAVRLNRGYSESVY